MSKFIAPLIIILFFIWLLPLGVFIKPAHEKIACGGQRAICLCSHSASKIKSNSVAGYGLKKASNNNKESNTSDGAGHYYLAAQFSVSDNLTARILNDSTFLAYQNLFLKTIEHIPNV